MITNNDIINAKIEGIKLCLYYLQHKKDVNLLINELLSQKSASTENIDIEASRQAAMD